MHQNTKIPLIEENTVFFDGQEDSLDGQKNHYTDDPPHRLEAVYLCSV